MLPRELRLPQLTPPPQPHPQVRLLGNPEGAAPTSSSAPDLFKHVEPPQVEPGAVTIGFPSAMATPAPVALQGSYGYDLHGAGATQVSLLPSTAEPPPFHS